ncbi:type IV pilus modification PilV family protein [Crocosphaera chwakensis]|uniref:Uncharacterized protein n=1 Tax=Crocosphaera chwakensis CCY0110 TaxID=391612 RepID=A3IKW8_9CHRO|nr:hypothetical protein [Crocosphaera chwakensis]EAZ92837.1 hypothetical protein CY0110_22112 [Crocosphaera chwakensis CCY0110]
MNKLLLTLILSRSKPKTDQGFSLFEVTIAILVSSAFLMGTLQAMTINAVMRVKSERQAQANFLIQQDIERLQAAASTMDLDYLESLEGQSSDPHPADTSDSSAICYPSPFASNLKDLRFGAYLVRELDSVLANDSDTNTRSDPAITANTVFSSAPTFNQLKTDANDNVLFDSNGKSMPDSEAKKDTNNSNKTVIVQIVNDQESLINKDYRLVRMMTVDSATSYQVLQVYYRVGEPYDPTDTNQRDNDNDKLRDDESGQTSIIAENYTEVIPAAVAECGFSP